MKKDLRKEVKRENIDDPSHRGREGREEGGRVHTHSRRRSKSSKGSRQKVESDQTSTDAHKIKVKAVRKHRPKEHQEGEVAQLQIDGASGSVLDVEYNPVAEVTT